MFHNFLHLNFFFLFISYVKNPFSVFFKLNYTLDIIYFYFYKKIFSIFCINWFYSPPGVHNTTFKLLRAWQNFLQHKNIRTVIGWFEWKHIFNCWPELLLRYICMLDWSLYIYKYVYVLLCICICTKTLNKGGVTQVL